MTKVTKGIVLAGGLGTRFRPFTKFTSKHLLPILDKPIIFYPISNFIRNGIKDILIISDVDNLKHYQKLLGSGSDIGVKFSYKSQKKPGGLPQALILGESFTKKKPFALNLGDHIVFGKNVDQILKKSFSNFRKNKIFTYNSSSTKDSGVLEFNKKKKKYIIVEKPEKTMSTKIITGLYLYNYNAVKLAKTLKPSKRNELEITDLNNKLIEKNDLEIGHFDKKNNEGFWFDAGDSKKVFRIQKKVMEYEALSNCKIANLHEIAICNKLVNKKKLLKQIRSENSEYFKYLLKKYEN